MNPTICYYTSYTKNWGEKERKKKGQEGKVGREMKGRGCEVWGESREDGDGVAPKIEENNTHRETGGGADDMAALPEQDEPLPAP
ncbi:hypothetical protein Syun_027530 [Stephania yunnanensis]|uniref:Uncharacterized protein n=1 Tax=Stephania yunnanensis TaxID=152371 RepID=A0AAP0EPM3_9MAGN